MKAKWFLTAFALVAGLSFTACNDNGDCPEPELRFPSKTTIEVDANKTPTITFTAEAGWILASDKDWCRFPGDKPQMTGSAGEQTIILTINDNNLNFDDVVAKLSLTMDNKEQVIFEITRIGINAETKMFVENANGQLWPLDEDEAVEIGFNGTYSKSVKIGVKANYNWKSIGALMNGEADYISFSKELAGPPNQDEYKDDFVTTEVSVYNYTDAADFETRKNFAYPAEGVIEIGDTSGQKQAEFKVKYTGMSIEDLFFIPTRHTSNAIEFSYMGNLYESDGAGGTAESDNKEYSFHVVTNQMEYDVVVLAPNENDELEVVEGETWLKYTDDGEGSIKISVAGDGINEGESRALYFYVFPKGKITNKDTYDYSRDYSPDWFERNNYGVKISQKAEQAVGGFELVWQGSATEVPSGMVTPADFLIGDIGNNAPEGNTFMYEISESNVSGALLVCPIGWTGMDSWGYKLVTLDGNWSAAALEYGSNYYTGNPGVSVGNLKQPEEGSDPYVESGTALMLFYNSEDDYDNSNPMGAMVLIK